MKKTHHKSHLKTQKGHEDKLSLIVKKAIKEKSLIVKNISHPEKEAQSLAQKIADWISWFSGSMPFLFLNALFFAVWILINTIPLGIEFFDPYPFGFLTLVVSLEAIFLSCFVLISQNRQEEKDRKRSESDYLINLKAELEVRGLHEKIDLLLQEQIDSQTEQLDILADIKKKIMCEPEKKNAKKK